MRGVCFSGGNGYRESDKFSLSMMTVKIMIFLYCFTIIFYCYGVNFSKYILKGSGLIFDCIL